VYSAKIIQPIGVNLCKKVLYEKEVLISTPNRGVIMFYLGIIEKNKRKKE